MWHVIFNESKKTSMVPSGDEGFNATLGLLRTGLNNALHNSPAAGR